MDYHSKNSVQFLSNSSSPQTKSVFVGYGNTFQLFFSFYLNSFMVLPLNDLYQIAVEFNFSYFFLPLYRQNPAQPFSIRLVVNVRFLFYLYTHLYLGQKVMESSRKASFFKNFNDECDYKKDAQGIMNIKNFFLSKFSFTSTDHLRDSRER